MHSSISHYPESVKYVFGSCITAGAVLYNISYMWIVYVLVLPLHTYSILHIYTYAKYIFK